ncbi:MAG: nucleoside-diphosphate-sugar epimerase [Desulforhopalus sp.]|jgi:nucleoside-diphosphate-sugar epimerase
MQKVLVTGANGFIGKALCSQLEVFKYQCVYVVRSPITGEVEGGRSVAVIDIKSNTKWKNVLSGVDVVIHLAGLAHVRKKYDKDLKEYREVNTFGTLNLARQAIKAKVKRLIYVSSIGVNGDWSSEPFTEKDKVNPNTPYTISKNEAEQGLRDLAKHSDIEIVIIRPPLVYGPNAPGNFKKLLSVIKKGVPLPLSGIKNKRSFISLGNLVNFIIICIQHSAASNETFVIGDGEDVSTPMLVHRLGLAIGKPVTLFFSPRWLLNLLGVLIGKAGVVNKLSDSLQVDASKAHDLLGWTPVETMDDGLRIIANWSTKHSEK